MPINKIIVDFPLPIELPEGFERALDGLINMICEKYRKENPDRVMWPASRGSLPIFHEPHEPTFDDSILHIEVAEREDYNQLKGNISKVVPFNHALSSKEAQNLYEKDKLTEDETKDG